MSVTRITPAMAAAILAEPPAAGGIDAEEREAAADALFWADPDYGRARDATLTQRPPKLEDPKE